MVEDWQGCKAKKCPYDKEHGNCEYCQYLVRKYDKSNDTITLPDLNKRKGEKQWQSTMWFRK